MKNRYGGLADAGDEDSGLPMPEIICDSATNSFLPACSYREIGCSAAKNLGTIFDRRIFIMAMAAAPFGLVRRGRKGPRVHCAARTAMFARRI